jgi:hypothetical protein
MEKFLFAKLEMWVVVLLALLGVVGTVGFGALVLDSERGQRHYGLASDIAHNIAQVPDTAKKLLKPNRDLMAYSNAPFRGKPTGWSFPSGPMRAPDGYLLLSRYDGNAHRHAIELVSMPDMKVRHRWTLETAALLKGVTPYFALLRLRQLDGEPFPPDPPDPGRGRRADRQGPLFAADAGRCLRQGAVDDPVPDFPPLDRGGGGRHALDPRPRRAAQPGANKGQLPRGYADPGEPGRQDPAQYFRPADPAAPRISELAVRQRHVQ